MKIQLSLQDLSDAQRWDLYDFSGDAVQFLGSVHYRCAEAGSVGSDYDAVLDDHMIYDALKYGVWEHDDRFGSVEVAYADEAVIHVAEVIKSTDVGDIPEWMLVKIAALAGMV